MLKFEDLKEKKRLSRGRRYFFAFIITAVLMSVALSFVKISHVDGNSMYPTLKSGNIFVAVDANFDSLKRGDIVCIKSLVLDELIIKRVIGLPGDKIEFVTDGVLLNGKRLSEDYVKEGASYTEGYTVTVPKGYVFVMGDNRDVSSDSRNIGCVSANEILYKYVFTIVE